MNALIGVSRLIDTVNTAVGRGVAWAILIACVVAAGNAIARKLLGLGSNAWLEMQWLLFSAAFLMAAPWTLKSNEHIRIDILTGGLGPRGRAWIDLAGHILFLLPVAAIILWTSLPFAIASFRQHEGSSNFGGLPQWPIKALIPLAFALLIAQGISEIIKRIAFLSGHLDDAPPGRGHRPIPGHGIADGAPPSAGGAASGARRP